MCKNSGDVEIGEHFKGVFIPNDLYGLSKKPCTCIGKYYDTERFFRSDDMCYYFSVKDAWGETDGYLAALRTGFVLIFTAPIDYNDLKEFAESPLPAKSTNGAVVQKAKRIAAKKVLEAVKKCSKQKTENDSESLEEIVIAEIESDKKPFKDLKDLMAQIYGEDSEEFKRLENDGVFEDLQQATNDV